MSASILTNTSAMVALQTLRSTNSSLEDVQNQISTGKRVATAKDNAAIFAITQTMESDVAGFKAISESLALGSSTLATASNASTKVGELLNEIKGKIVAANEDNVDRTQLQAEVESLRGQIAGIVGAAQFNGLNLLSNTEKTAGSGTVSVLSSLDRASDGTVTSSNIDVQKQDLGTGASAITGTAETTGGVFLSGAAAGAAVTLTGAATAPTTTFTIADAEVVAGAGYSIVLASGAGDFASGVNTTTGTGQVSEIQYVARDGDTAQDVFDALNRKLEARLEAADVAGEVTMAFNSSTGAVTVTGSTTTGNNVSFRADAYLAAGNTVGGGLEDLANIDVSTDAGAAQALTDIELLIETTIEAQAAFGTSEKRVEIQSEFMTSLIDSFKSGIGALVDADLEEASARLQALQVQQQLGVQALSIANQAPQNILALFR